MYGFANVFLQGDSVILEKSKNIKTHQKIHFMEVASHELLQVANMMFWEVDTSKKKKKKFKNCHSPKETTLRV